MPNQRLAECIFTPSLLHSKDLLATSIWHTYMFPEGADIIQKMISKGEDLAFVKRILTDGETLEKHKRIKTVDDVKMIILQQPVLTLETSLEMDHSDLLRQNLDMDMFPKTEDERHWKILEEVERIYLKSSLNFEQNEGDDEEEDDNNDDDSDEEDNNDENKDNTGPHRDGGALGGNTLIWNRPFRNPEAGYQLYATVWARVNIAAMLYDKYVSIFNKKDVLLAHKLARFRDAHLKVAAYLDGLPDPHDAHIDVAHFESLYTPLGESRYRDDLGFVTARRTLYKTRKTTLKILREAFPHLLWSVEEVVKVLAESAQDEFLFNEMPPNLIDGYWTPCPEATFETHSIYFGCIYILNQCKWLISTHQQKEEDGDTTKVKDALWSYYAAFTDLFYDGIPNGMSDAYLLTPMGSTTSKRLKKTFYSDSITPWEAFGSNLDVRTFEAADLPDLYHVLCDIPLWGEQRTPSYRIGKIYQKSLPFACQRRLLIQLIVRTINEDESFWRVFSRLTWVMLASLYPGDMGTNSHLGMRDLLRAKELSESKELLIDAITADQAGFGKPAPVNGKASGANGGPLLVFVIFRLHIVYMATVNPEFVSIAKKCIDWDDFRSNTIHLGNLIRESGLFPQDPFAQARLKLSKTVKSPASKVHRFSRRTKAVSIMEQVNDTLEKTIIRDFHNRRADVSLMESIRLESSETARLKRFQEAMRNFQDRVTLETMYYLIQKRLDINQKALTFYEQLLNVDCKSNILNTLMKIPQQDRLTIRGFALLSLPQYGGVSYESITAMLKLVVIYHENAVPKRFRECIDAMNLKDFVIVAFYFNMVALLEKVQFVTLDAQTTERTVHALKTRRYHLEHTLTTLPKSAYTVCVALCCEKVCSLMGTGKLGAKSVSYDIERRTFVCTHGKALRPTSIQDDTNENDDDAADAADAADGDDGDDEKDAGHSDMLYAQNDRVEDVLSSMRVSTIIDFTADAATKRGRGTKRHAEMESRKMVRNERKLFNRIPCHQPILQISLFGRALVWNGQSQIMFCPECGALHVSNISNFSGAENGLYRCNECAQTEIFHRQHIECAYCEKSTPSQMSENFKLEVTCDTAGTDFEQAIQWLYFCRTHYNIARRFVHKCPKQVLWQLIAKVERERVMKQAAKN